MSLTACRRRGSLVLFALSFLVLTASLASAQRSRLQGPIQSTKRVALTGHVRPQLESAIDDGPMDPAEPIHDLTMVLRPSAQQQSDLDQLLKEQQDPASGNYHRWLSPEEYAARFGASAEDADKISTWLKQQNLEVISVARARNSIRFRGTAGAVGAALGTQFRHYIVNGTRHFANGTEPSVPQELEFLVSSIQGLNDFRMQPQSVKREAAPTDPRYTSSSGSHYLSPDDLATIYNVQPLYAAGLDGTGQTIVVAGQTQMDMSNVSLFRAKFGLSSLTPQAMLVPGSRDPGVSSGDVEESNLDLQWSGAVARNATILYVYAASVMDAVQYAIDQNLAPVITVSYGLCEQQTSAADMRAFQTWAQQANAQGITWVNSAGDSGGADCWSGKTGSGGFAVDAPASVPEVTAIGGTTLTDGTGSYWVATNNATGASALSYIPETAWNDSTSSSPAAGGGGASVFFLKPSWQTGAGVPNNGARNVPDISLAASPDHNGYLVYTGGKLSIFGGTSAGAPTFAGMIALLNQDQARNGAGAGVGNINPRLYSLAQTLPTVFHDVTAGNNIVTVACSSRQRNCAAGSYGYNAGPSYDQASGLGSVNAYNLVTGWQGTLNSITPGTTSMTLTAGVSNIAPGDSITLTATVSASNGGVPSGSVTFRIGTSAVGTATLVSGSAKVTLTGAVFVLGSNTISAEYSGSSSYASSTASTIVTVTAASTGPPTISGVTNAASFRTAYAPGMLLSIFGSQLAPATWSATSVPLPTQIWGVSVTVNGVSAPLLYASPSQLNVQIPYEVTVNETAVLSVSNNGKTANSSIAIANAAPGVFVDSAFALVPGSSGQGNQIMTLFVTGVGAVAPFVSTGAAPSAGTSIANLPKPQQNLTVTVGGLPAVVQFAGIPAGLVGVVQVNYQIPQQAALGSNAVVVQIGNASSASAKLTVTP